MEDAFRAILIVEYDLDGERRDDFVLVLQSMCGLKARILDLRVRSKEPLRKSEEQTGQQIPRQRFPPSMTQSQDGLSHTGGPWSERPDSQKVTAVAPDMSAGRAEVTRRPKKSQQS